MASKTTSTSSSVKATSKPAANNTGKKHVFTTAEVKDLLTKDPNSLSFEKKKAPQIAKKKTGKDDKSSVDYYNVYLKNASGKHRFLVRIKNVTITSSPPNPNDVNDPRRQYVKDDKDACAIGSNLSASGELGEVMPLIEKAFFAYVDKMKKSGEIDDQTIRRDMLQKKIKTGENKGKLLDSPVFRMVFDGTKYPDDYYDKSQCGLPRSDIRDASKIVTNAKGAKEYAQAMVDDEPISKNNLYKFATKGSIIQDGRLHMDQFSVSNMGVSMKIILARAVIRQVIGSQGFDDDDDDELNVDDGNDSGPTTPVTSSSGKPADDAVDDVPADDADDDAVAADDDTAPADDDAVDAGYDADNADG